MSVAGVGAKSVSFEKYAPSFMFHVCASGCQLPPVGSATAFASTSFSASAEVMATSRAVASSPVASSQGVGMRLQFFVVASASAARRLGTSRSA